MRFVSTRGGDAVGFMDALFGGLAPNGGLYVPEAWPAFGGDALAAFAGRPYAEVAADILLRFTGDELPADVARQICAEAYATFDHPEVAPLRRIDDGLLLLELFHGPTLAFKDVAMQLLARLYEHGLNASGRDLTIVCATSGDTGGAAVEAFAGRDHVRIVALYPEGRISEVQRRFMTTSAHNNVRAVAVEGDFDVCQALLKGLYQDQVFADEIGLSVVNSINIARVIAQIVYYVTAAAAAAKALAAPDRAISFAVPTGNFGDAYAGWAARRMGLPMEKIIIATNVNDILPRAWAAGVYRRGVAAATQSPSMDIQVASNFERLVFDGLGGDAAAVAAAFREFGDTGAMILPAPVLTLMRDHFEAVAVDESLTAKTIADAWSRNGLLIDPHTAVAMAGAMASRETAAKPIVVLSTAHPAKFPDAVEAATGQRPEPPAAVVARATLPERIDRLPASAPALKAYLRDFASGRS